MKTALITLLTAATVQAQQDFDFEDKTEMKDGKRVYEIPGLKMVFEDGFIEDPSRDPNEPPVEMDHSDDEEDDEMKLPKFEDEQPMN